jgi:hypothetical protein
VTEVKSSRISEQPSDFSGLLAPEICERSVQLTAEDGLPLLDRVDF